MVKVGVIGACGRMGQRILEILSNDKNVSISSAIDSKDNPLIGTKIFKDLDVNYSSDLYEFIDSSDVFIDFTTPLASLKNIEILSSKNKPIVLGTTGFNDDQVKLIHEASKNTAIVFSPNMSIGVNVFFKVLADASKLLKDYDIEITEIHHNKKKDAPSGTAVKIAEIITENTSRKKEDWVYGREGLVGERTKEEIGIHSLRLGDVVGDHSVYFCGNNERIELTHRAHSRDNFASGAVKASKWIYGKDKGLYDMFDVLGLRIG